MKKQIIRVSPVQCAKVAAGLYFVFSIPLVLIMALVASFSGLGGASMTMMIAMPFLYVIFGFIFTAIGALLYNLVAGFVGGVEYTTVDVGQ